MTESNNTIMEVLAQVDRTDSVKDSLIIDESVEAEQKKADSTEEPAIVPPAEY